MYSQHQCDSYNVTTLYQYPLDGATACC